MSTLPGKSGQQLAEFRERIRVFIAAIQAGQSNRAAAAEAHIGAGTLTRWRAGKRPFDVIMRQKMERAIAVRERRWITAIESAATTPMNNGAPGDWKAAAWMLERTAPDEFGPTRAVSGRGGGPIEIGVEQTVEHVLLVPNAERIAAVVGILGAAGKLPMLPINAETPHGNGNGNGNGHRPEDNRQTTG